MGDDNGNGCCFMIGVVFGVIGLLVIKFLIDHLQWVS